MKKERRRKLECRDRKHRILRTRSEGRPVKVECEQYGVQTVRRAAYLAGVATLSEPDRFRPSAEAVGTPALSIVFYPAVRESLGVASVKASLDSLLLGGQASREGTNAVYVVGEAI